MAEMELIDYVDLKNQLLSISDVRDRAFLCTVYAAMARVGEVTRGRYRKTRAMIGKEITSFPNKIEIYVKSEKNFRPRKIPIFRNRESWLCDNIEGWRDRIGQGALFPYSTRWGETVFSKWFPDIHSNRGGDINATKHTIHWLRAWRYSHYRRGEITGSKVESKIVALMGGWVSTDIPERCYDLTKIDDHMEELENA